MHNAQCVVRTFIQLRNAHRRLPATQIVNNSLAQ
jgi:hypothetical protein